MGFAAYTVQLSLSVPPEFTNLKLTEQPNAILKAPYYPLQYSKNE